LEHSIAADLRARNPEAIDRLLHAHGREIQAVAFLILRDRDDAADVLAETVVIAWEKARSIRDEAALRPWLLRVATNRALGMRRRGARLIALETIPEPDLPAQPDPTGGSATRLALLAGVAALPVRQRAAIVLHYYADLPVDDVAAALGTSRNTVKTQLRDGLARLREALGDERPSGAPEISHA
jgi:RNA polymerase sigma-70 factor (ECF subfamily)